MNNWISCESFLPKEGLLVETKIDDNKGCRNEQNLIRKGKLWFTSDMKMYVYYAPTHWRYLS